MKLAHTLVAGLCLCVVTGCAGTTSSGKDAVGTGDTPWYCQIDPTGADWQCAEGAKRSQLPAPRRLEPLPLPSTTTTVARQTQLAPLGNPLLESPPEAVDESAATPTYETEGAGESGSMPAFDTPPEVLIPGTPLQELPREYYAVQLVASSDKATLETLAPTLQVSALSAARVERDGAIFYVLLLGIYPDLASATRAAEERPEPLRSFTPWVRTMGSLQDAMSRADLLTGSSSF